MSEAVLSQLTYLETITFRDDGGVLVTTAVNADFTKTVIANGAASSVVCTVTQIGSTGRYTPSLTPDAVGDWTVIVEWTADPTFAWSYPIRVITAAQADPAAALEGFVATATATVSDTSADFTLRRGDTYRRNLTITQPDGSLYDLNGATVWLTVKQRGDRSADDSAAVLKLYWVSGGASSGIVAASPSAGVIAVTITATQTAALSVGSFDYEYDVQVEKAGLIDTPITGGVIVERDVTIRTTTP